MTNAGANILISLINGSAFNNSLTLAQHRLLAQLRAVECRRAFLRCAATGETCVISPIGTITQHLPIHNQGILVADLPLFEGETLYSRFGELLPLVCGGLLLLCIWRQRVSTKTAA